MTADPRPALADTAVVELRQYTLHPGRRDELIELFDREFVETQEAVGMRVLGQFRDVDDPDRFVWLRGFPDMATRRAGLTAFYGGPVWAAHRAAANATMVDSDDVLLLRPVRPGSGFALPGRDRPPRGARTAPPSILTATVCPLAETDDDFALFFETAVAPALTAAGGRPVARFETEPSANDFPALPVRTGERVFVWFSAFADAPAHGTHLRALAQLPEWQDAAAALAARLSGPAHRLRLQPTARSLLR